MLDSGGDVGWSVCCMGLRKGVGMHARQLRGVGEGLRGVVCGHASGCSGCRGTGDSALAGGVSMHDWCGLLLRIQDE